MTTFWRSEVTIPVVLTFIAALDLLTPVGIVLCVLYVVPVYLSSRLPFAPTRQSHSVYGVAAVSSALTLLGFIVSPNGGIQSIAVTNRLIALLLIASAAILVLRQVRLFAENVELRALLPICSYCKSIRDERGGWHRVDDYLHRHTGVQFTHGMCPDCLEVYMEAVRKESTVQSTAVVR